MFRTYLKQLIPNDLLKAQSPDDWKRVCYFKNNMYYYNSRNNDSIYFFITPPVISFWFNFFKITLVSLSHVLCPHCQTCMQVPNLLNSFTFILYACLILSLCISFHFINSHICMSESLKCFHAVYTTCCTKIWYQYVLHFLRKRPISFSCIQNHETGKFVLLTYWAIIIIHPPRQAAVHHACQAVMWE